MKINKPDYYDKFKCIADKCTMTCCQERKIYVDDNTFKDWDSLTDTCIDNHTKSRGNISLL